MPALLCQLLSHWRAINKKVEIVRCDNAGENRKFEELAKSGKYQLGITLEYTARSTPEQNSRVEKSIETKYNRTRACLAFDHIPEPIKHYILRECVTQVTNTSNLELLTIRDKKMCRYEAFYGIRPAYANHLHVFGEAYVVHDKKIATKKWKIKEN